ncbi:hypothetical protein GUJ93_ZPchr0010g9836 [Zizania palustris]|uniref:Uncharacterized protein n=1 Tax=Zizania palustris TaxID=103762 RepID=A0A8J6BKE2_ZIZPA|nr:hypothetical protein GUJ93_ZPchr0010g9836 [Zizania palustris]
MGNSLPLPCACEEATAVATSGVKKRRNKTPAARRSKVYKAAARHLVPVAMPEEDEEMKWAWPGCRVEPAAGADGMRVKVVLKRKDAAELMARLEERCALERKARMVELNSGLGGGNRAIMSPSRDALTPRLASIPEN